MEKGRASSKHVEWKSRSCEVAILMERWPQCQDSPLKAQVWGRSSGVFAIDRGVLSTLQQLAQPQLR